MAFVIVTTFAFMVIAVAVIVTIIAILILVRSRKVRDLLKKRLMVSISVGMLVLIYLMVGMVIRYYVIHSEGYIKKSFFKNQKVFEQLIETIETKEPYKSAYLGNDAVMDLGYLKGKIVKSRFTKSETEIDDVEFRKIFKKLSEVCSVVTIYVESEKITFRCHSLLSTISFVYSTQGAPELNRLQEKIDDNWYIEWFRGA